MHDLKLENFNSVFAESRRWIDMTLQTPRASHNYQPNDTNQMWLSQQILHGNFFTFDMIVIISTRTILASTKPWHAYEMVILSTFQLYFYSRTRFVQINTTANVQSTYQPLKYAVSNKTFTTNINFKPTWMTWQKLKYCWWLRIQNTWTKNNQSNKNDAV